MLSIESGLITCGTRIIVPREMRPEMLQYRHEGHQSKEHYLLRAKNTVFWPKITFDIQQLIEKCMILQEYGKSQPLIEATQELCPFLLEKNGLSDSCRCLLQVHPSEEIANFHLCSHVHRIVYGCHIFRFTSYNQE